MAISLKRNAFLSRFKPFLSSQRWFNHGLVEGGPGAQYHSDSDSDEHSVFQSGISKMSNWKRMDSRSLGITRSMISLPSLIVLKGLKSKGHEAYLVGGCVRDLLLKKTPKDFDVITTAGLQQIRKQFHRAMIVGRKFPICIVHVGGSVIEVSSFQTVANHDKNRQKVLDSRMPKGCDYSDLIRWKDSMRRDFTINSLFFDPFVHKIYDYANGMKDLSDLKLRTLLPAQLSFKEDSARILRGLRIAARLGLSLSNETETAIDKLSSTISRLDKSRITMELNYMLSYGAAEPSLRLLQRFHLLDLFLPFHAAYLSQQATRPGPVMLMRLFFHLDQLVACDRPSNSSLWIGLLAFHLALVKNPQHPHVVCTFASVLYHGKWKDSVEFAKQYSQTPAIFAPETSQTRDVKSDDELSARVKEFSLQVKDSLNVLIEEGSLRNVMNIFFPDFPCSNLVFVSKKMGNYVGHLFDNPLRDDLQSKRRKHFEINYDFLRKGDIEETRFALGKIIMDTMRCGVYQGGRTENSNNDGKHDASDSTIQQDNARRQKLMRKANDISKQGTTAKQNETLKRKLEKLVVVRRNLVENAYDSILRDNATKKRDEVTISLIKKKKGQKVAKENKEVVNKACANASEEQKVATSQSPWEQLIWKLKTKVNTENEKHLKRNESFKETLVDLGECFPEKEVTQENATEKRDEVAISPIEKKNGQKVAKKKKQVVGKACANVSEKKRDEVTTSLFEKNKGQKVAKKNKEVVNKACANVSEEQNEVATSQSPWEQVIWKLKTKVNTENQKHPKRNESLKETLVDLGECFPEKEVTQENATKKRDEVTISLIVKKNGQKVAKKKKQVVGKACANVSEKKQDEVMISLFEKKKGQKVAKKNKEVVNKACAKVSEEQNEVTTSQSPCEQVIWKLKTKVNTENENHLKRDESFKETLVDLGECFPEKEVTQENATKKRDEVAISPIEKKNGQKVAKKKKQVVGKACANVSEEQEKVATSEAPWERVVRTLKTMVKDKCENHLKRNETLLDLGECVPENEVSEKQQKSVETYDPPRVKEVRTEECHANPPRANVKDKEKHNKQEKQTKLKLSSLFK